MSLRRIFVALGFMSCLPSTVASQPRTAPEVPVQPGDFRDKVNDRLPTSGATLFGLIDGSLGARITKPTVFVSGIEKSDRTICVAIRQITGAYSADFTVRNPGRGGLVAFRLPKQKMNVRGRSSAELAILARASAGGECSRRDPILPSAWNAPPGDKLVALVNNHQADRTRTVRPQRDGDCSRLSDLLPGRALTAYQVACTVQLPAGNCAALPLAIQLDNAGQTIFVRDTVRRGCL